MFTEEQIQKLYQVLNEKYVKRVKELENIDKDLITILAQANLLKEMLITIQTQVKE